MYPNEVKKSMGSVSMALPVYMLAKKVSFPCTGAFSVRAGKGRSWLFASGVIARETGVKRAYLPARRVQHCIEQAAKKAVAHRDRRGVLEEVWSALYQLPKGELGKKQGADLSLIMTSGDERGINLCAINISGLWGRKREDEQWVAVLPKKHPLFDIYGIEEDFPGSLHIEHPPKCILATAHPLFPMLPTEDELKERLRVQEL